MDYARFGAGWVSRESEKADWYSCAESNVPSWRIADELVVAERRAKVAAGEHPDGSAGGGSAVILANPAVEAMAAELGLSADELRSRLNGSIGGTRQRVDESRFDEIAEALGVTPTAARDRFADRG